MLADCIDSEYFKMNDKNIGVYFARVKMFVNSESVFAKKNFILEEVNESLNIIVDTDFGNSVILIDSAEHTVYTSTLIRYVFFIIKTAMFNSAYDGDDFVNLCGLIGEVELSHIAILNDGTAYIESHKPSGKLNDILKELQSLSKEYIEEKKLFEQYYRFISDCVCDHDIVDGGEW